MLWLAQEHAVGELIAHQLLSSVADNLPTGVREQLGAVSAHAAARNGLMLSELGEVQAALAREGIASVALKGTALIAAHYPSIAARFLSDIDLLVATEDVRRAVATLVDAGSSPLEGLPPALDGRTDALARNPGADHLRPLVTARGVMLELHDHLPGGGPRATDVIARSTKLSWQGRALTIPPPEDLAGMLSRHVFLKHGDDHRLRARHVADLAALERGAIVDWGVVSSCYGGGLGRRAVKLSLRLLAAARAEADGEYGAARRPGLLAPAAGPRAVVGQLRTAFTTLPNALRWREVLRAAFPARRYMESRFGLRPGSPWMPLLYPWRLLVGFLARMGRR
jgi:hypothetical protein